MKVLDIHYNRKNIGELVGNAATYLKNELRKDLEKSLVCVKVDCAIRHHWSFLGMNVQVVKEDEIVIYTLAVHEIQVRRTTANLKTLVFNELENYWVLLKHIYTTTSENGSNLAKANDLIEDLQQEDYELLAADTEATENEDNAINDEFISLILNADWKSDRIMGIRCVAHVLQLCVSNTLKNS